MENYDFSSFFYLFVVNAVVLLIYIVGYCNNFLWTFSYPKIGHFHRDHNAPCSPPKILHNHCLRFLVGDCDTQEKFDTIVMQNLGEWTKCIMVSVKMVNKAISAPVCGCDPCEMYPGYQGFFLVCDEELRRPQADTSSAVGRRQERWLGAIKGMALWSRGSSRGSLFNT